jgi:predicted Zn finger-like uncharacterized protein
MILTCPECATRYFVQDDTLGAAGRTVRCTNCKSSWHATPTPEAQARAPLELVLDDEEGAVARDPYDLDVEPAAAAATPADLPGEELPKLFRERVKRSERLRKAAAAGAVWGLLSAACVAALGAAAVYRADVVRAWPKTASVFAAVGLPVNTTGLVIEDAHADQEFVEGRPSLVVRGAIRNVRGTAAETPPLKVTLLNAQGKPVKTEIARAGEATIPAGATRYFVVDVSDPPSSVTQAEVRFLLDRKALKAAEAKEPALRSVEVAEAEPEHAVAAHE